MDNNLPDHSNFFFSQESHSLEAYLNLRESYGVGGHPAAPPPPPAGMWSSAADSISRPLVQNPSVFAQPAPVPEYRGYGGYGNYGENPSFSGGVSSYSSGQSSVYGNADVFSSERPDSWGGGNPQEYFYTEGRYPSYHPSSSNLYQDSYPRPSQGFDDSFSYEQPGAFVGRESVDQSSPVSQSSRFSQSSPVLTSSFVPPDQTGYVNAPVENEHENKMMKDWEAIKNVILDKPGEDPAINEAIKNLSVVYSHSPAFQGMVASLRNAGGRISIQSGTSVSHGKFFPEKSIIKLNTTKLKDPGKLLAVLVLHLTYASYLKQSARMSKGGASNDYKKQSLDRMAVYYAQAATQLDVLGLGGVGVWVKQSRAQKNVGVQESEVHIPTIPEPLETQTEAVVAPVVPEEPQDTSDAMPMDATKRTSQGKKGWAKLGKMMGSFKRLSFKNRE